MSFLRNFRSNLMLSTAPPPSAAHGTTTMRTTGKSSTAGPVKASGGSRKNSATANRPVEEPDHRALNGGRRSSSNSVRTVPSQRYGTENPAPIVIYLDKQPDAKKQPVSILRTETFSRHDDTEPERIRHAITRSDTFTIDETTDAPTTINTGTYTRPAKTSTTPTTTTTTTDVFEPLYAKNISLSSHEKLPVVVDSRTYRRKKSLKSSKPVQKVESFIKRFERTLFSKASNNAVDTKRYGASPRKGSTASEAAAAGPRFRDVGINCKLDEEEKFKAKLEALKRSRQSSRDSLVSYRERSLSPAVNGSNKPRMFTPGTYDRRSSSSLSAGVVVQPLKEDPPPHGYNDGSVESTTPPHLPTAYAGRSTLYRPTESSFLKSRQKEIEMGYSVVNKRHQPPLSLAGSPDRGPGKSTTIVTTTGGRTSRTSQEQTPYASASSRYAPPTTGRRDTYQTLKDEYETRQQLQLQASKPIGIASPRMSATPSAERSDNFADLPKYTFGTDLQQRRSRFQQFQKSFKKMDDSASEVSVQQSFFVPI